MDKRIRKGNTITIDLDYWVTQAEKARLDGEKDQYVRQRVVRAQQAVKADIEIWTIPELGLTLIKRDQRLR